MSNWRVLRDGGSAFAPLTHRTRLSIISAALLAVALIGLLFVGFDPGTDFTGGGTAIEAGNADGLTLAGYRDALADAGFGAARVQRTVDGGGVLVRTGALDASDREALVAAVASISGVDPSELSAEETGPTVDWNPHRLIITATALFAAVAVVIIGWRIGLKAALTALAVLVFDVVVTVGVFALTGLEVFPATAVAVVAIAAYSLYDTVIVLDRVKDAHGEVGARFDFEYVGNLAINRVLLRSVTTGVAVTLGVLVAVVLAALGAGTGPLLSVLVVLLIGVLVSTYSSPALGVPLLALWPQPLPGPRSRGRSRRRRREPRPATLTDETEDTGAVARPPRHSKRR